MARQALGAALLAASLPACVLPAARFEGLACDDDHACQGDTVCADGRCLRACDDDDDCDDGLACADGACRTPAQPNDAGVPSDAGPSDAGPSDAGTSDAGPDAGDDVDAGPSELCFSDPPYCAPSEIVVTVCPNAPCPDGRTATSLGAAAQMLVDGEVVIFVPPDLDLSDTTISDGNVTIVGAEGSRIDNLTVAGTATVRLLRIATFDPLRVSNSGRLIVEECFVAFEDTCLSGTSATTIEARRSVFYECAKGAITTTGAIAVENCVFAHNGSIGGGANGSNLGAVRMDGPAVSNVFRFNTLVSNHANNAPAADCGDPETRIEHSVIFDNQGENSGTPHVLGCAIAGSLVDFTPPPDAGNLEGDPELLDGGYHLAPTSPAIDQASGGSGVDVDIDGEARPMGAARDLGADEAG